MLPGLTTVQRDFSGGQVTEKAARRDDVALQRSGLKRAVNTRVLATGALAQRMGRSAYGIDEGRTEIVRFSDTLRFEFLFGEGALKIRDNAGAVLNTFTGLPWTVESAPDVGMAVAERDVFLTFPGTRPRHLRLGAVTTAGTSDGPAFGNAVDTKAYPSIAATNTSREDSVATAHSVALPAGIAVGDLLLIFFRTGDGTHTHSAPGGWDALATMSDGNGRQTIFWRYATGSEGGSVTVGSSAAVRSTHISARIVHAHGAPEAAFDPSQTTNPPSLSPSWGSDKNLWIATLSMLRSAGSVTVAPSGYSGLVQIGNTSSTDDGRCRTAIAYRQNTSGSENPGAFSTTGSATDCYAGTAAARPLSDALVQAGAFDGNTNKAATGCIKRSGATSAYVGLDLSGAPSAVTGVTVYGSNNQGFVDSANPNITITLYGKNGSPPANATDGTSLGVSGTTADTTNESGGRSVTSSDQVTAYDYIWATIAQSGGAADMYIAQVVFTVPASTLSEDNWLLGNFGFEEAADAALRQPYVRYAARGIEMLPSARSGAVTVTFDGPVLDPAHVGVRFRFHEREVVITSVSSPTSGTANVIERLPPARRVVCQSANARDSFKPGQVVVGGTSGAEGLIAATNTASVTNATVTMTIAYPAVVTWSGHKMQAGDPFVFTTSGSLPDGVVAGQTYYVSATSLAAGTFQFSDTPGGASVNTSGSQSGTHTGTFTRQAIDVIVYKGDNFLKDETIVSPTGKSRVIGTPIEIALPASTVWDEAAMSDFRGWPQSVTWDRSRLILCDFPQSPRAIAYSAVGAPLDMAVGAEASDGFLEFAPGSGRVRHVVGGADQFVLTDLGVMYIPISEANPLRPGGVAFRPIAAVGAGSVRPVQMHEGVVYTAANGKSLIAIVPTGQTSFPYRTAMISEFHADLITGIRGLAAMTGGGTGVEQYLWVVQDDGTALVGKFDPSNEWVGFVPVTGTGLIRWISSLGGEVRFNTDYETAAVLELLDEAMFLDCSVPLNRGSPPLRPDPDDPSLGRLWFLAGLDVALMDGETYLGTRTVDEDGFVEEEDGDDFSGEDVVAGFAFTVDVRPWLPNQGEGEQRGQRMRRRRVKRAGVTVQASTAITFMGREFGGLEPASDTYRAPGHVRMFEPEVTLSKATPGPLRIVELSAEITT